MQIFQIWPIENERNAFYLQIQGREGFNYLGAGNNVKMMADEGQTTKAQYWIISEFPPHLTNKLWGELKEEQADELTLNMDGASQSSFWKDQRIKANNPYKTKDFAASWGTGAFTCTHTENDKAGAWWKATFTGSEPVTVTKI
jgi:hypothetical protein